MVYIVIFNRVAGIAYGSLLVQPMVHNKDKASLINDNFRCAFYLD